MTRSLWSLALLLGLCLFAACASVPKQTEVVADKVVARSEGLTARPSWVSENTSVVAHGDTFSFIGMVETPGDSRVQMALKASDAASRGQVATMVASDITNIFQAAQSAHAVQSEGKRSSTEDQQVTSLIQEASHVTLHQIDIRERYWEKVVRTESDGSEKVVLKTFSILDIPKRDLKSLLLGAIGRSQQAEDSRLHLKSLVERLWEETEGPR